MLLYKFYDKNRKLKTIKNYQNYLSLFLLKLQGFTLGIAGTEYKGRKNTTFISTFHLIFIIS